MKRKLLQISADTKIDISGGSNLIVICDNSGGGINITLLAEVACGDIKDIAEDGFEIEVISKNATPLSKVSIDLLAGHLIGTKTKSDLLIAPGRVNLYHTGRGNWVMW